MILGHERQIAYLDKVFRRGTAAHAYIFSGPDHVGKGAVAKEWIKKFFCLPSVALAKGGLSAEAGAKADGKICGICLSCKHIEANTHPDVTHVSLEHQLVENPKTEIGVDTAREIKRRASIAPYGGGYRFFLIDGAELLNAEAQNTLLKILEEPGERTVFIFLVTHVSGLLPTIVSRSVMIPFFLVPDGVMRTFLETQKISKNQREHVVSLAQGRPGRLMLLLRDTDALGEASGLMEKAKNVFGAGLLELFRVSDSVALDAKNQEQFFMYFFYYVHKQFHAEEPEQLIGRLEKTKKVMELFRLYRQTNLNQKLIFDHMFLASRF